MHRATSSSTRVICSGIGMVIGLDGEEAREVERYNMSARIRSIVQGPAGALWVLEDERDDSRGRLLKLTPKN